MAFLLSVPAPSPWLTAGDLETFWQSMLAIDANMQIDRTNGFALAKSTSWTPEQESAVQAAIAALPARSPQLRAQERIDGWPIEMKALLLTLLDQINVLRTRAGLATVTPAQALQAVRDKAGTL